MIKRDFLNVLHEDLKEAGVVMKRDESKVIMDVFFNSLFRVITSGITLTISNFGIFKSSLYSYRDPRGINTERIERWNIKFSPSKAMKTRINGALQRLYGL